jgi:HAD superfamily hydrolase (TIGR01509 family)
MANQTVDTILFDLAEVYMRGLKGANEALGEQLGQPIPEALLLGNEAVQLFHGEITETEYWEALLATHRWEIEVDDLKALARRNFTKVEGTEEVVTELKAAGYRLGLLSIHAREWIEHCEREHRHHRHFDVVVYSYECGLSKPDPAAYEYALAALGADPERTVFTDDNPEYVRGAEAVGIRSILFEDAEQLRARLVEMRILPASPGGR